MIEEASGNQGKQDNDKSTEVVPESLAKNPVSTQHRIPQEQSGGEIVKETTNQNEQSALQVGEKPVTNFERKIAIIGVGLAVITAALFYVQLKEMTYQTQILGSQSESAAAGAAIGEMNTRKQLSIVQGQVKAAQKQAEATANQVSIMRKQFEAADRPWIAVDVSINSALRYDEKGVQVGFNIIPKNVGRSPAQNIWIAPRLTPAYMGEDLSNIQKHICKGAAGRTNAMLRYILFPSDHYTQPIGLSMSVEEINSHWGKLPPDIGTIDPVPIALIGCVDYTYESSTRHHQTGFAVDVLMKDGRLPLKSKTPLAPEDLILRAHSFGGHFAN